MNPDGENYNMCELLTKYDLITLITLITLLISAELIPRQYVDYWDGKNFTFIYTKPFVMDGFIRKLQVFAGQHAKVKIGIFKPEGGVDCRFKFVREIGILDFSDPGVSAV